ncbi:MAG TPA: hypothetical protein HPP77_03330 [Candidatus Hydrogenedentes bacterium]|nr:hypothetical protein [Candidatus Hydrogenedentota bacterium]
MTQLRKILNWVWLHKELFMLCALVAVLLYYVFRVFRPPELVQLNPVALPRRNVEAADLPDLPNDPGPPPVPNPAGNWASIYEQNPLWVYSGTTRGPDDANSDEPKLDIKLLNISVQPGGKALAQIRTNTKKWYEEGENFENFKLLDIDPEAGTVTVYSEKIGKTVTLERSP